MPKGWTITTKEGDTLTIEEWLEKKEKKSISLEYEREQEKEVKNHRRCLKRRIVKNSVSPEYDSEYSKVRYLTDEEIIKEYIMPDQENKGKSKAYRILVLMKELGGRGVLTTVIASGIKENRRNVSAILSQLHSAKIVDSVGVSDNKGLFLWKINKEIEKIPNMTTDIMVTIYNKYVRSVRKRNKKESKVFVETNEHLSEKVDKSVKEEELGKRLEELIEEEPKLSTLSSNTLKIIVEGNIKILFGLVK